MNAKEHSRFLQKVCAQPNGCWLWMGARTSYNEKVVPYGRCFVGGKHRLAHRVAYEYWVDPIPAGLDILHSCDASLCVNPKHLSPGTKHKNIRDCIARGRGNRARGEAQGGAKLNAAAVLFIRRQPYRRGLFASLAEEFSVTPEAVASVYYRRTWKHL